MSNVMETSADVSFDLCLFICWHTFFRYLVPGELILSNLLQRLSILFILRFSFRYPTSSNRNNRIHLHLYQISLANLGL